MVAKINNLKRQLKLAPKIAALAEGKDKDNKKEGKKKRNKKDGSDLGRMANLKLVDKRGKELVELKLQVLA